MNLRGIRQFFASPIFEDQEQTRIAGLLATILRIVLTLLILFTPLGVLAGLAQGRLPPGLLLGLAGAAAILSLFPLMRRGHIKLVSVLLTCTLMGIVTLAPLIAGNVSDPSVSGYAVVVTVAGLLLGGRAAFVFAGLSVFALAGIRYVETPNLSAIPALFSSSELATYFGVFGAIAALLDLAARNINEALTRAHNEASRRQAILQSIGDGVIVLDNAGKVILSNPATSRLLTIPIEKIVYQNFDDILQSSVLLDPDRKLLMQILGQAEATMAPMRIHWGKKTLSIKVAPLRDMKSQMIGNIAVLRDFSHEAEVEEMKNTFMAMVSHELTTPLNAILGYSELMRDAAYGPVNDKQANIADRILKNSRRLLDIVRDLLDKSQIESGRLALQWKEFKTVDMVENLHSVMDKIANDKGLKLSSSIAPEMPEMLKSDPQRLQQVMVNLVNNAVKFTQEGGINVRLYRITEEHWAFDVTDTGPGIAVEDQKYIFDAFRQVGGAASHSQAGVGLGLAIVKGIIDLMGGRVFVQSALGQGTTFKVVLPFEPPAKHIEAMKANKPGSLMAEE